MEHVINSLVKMFLCVVVMPAWIAVTSPAWVFLGGLGGKNTKKAMGAIIAAPVPAIQSIGNGAGAAHRRMWRQSPKATWIFYGVIFLVFFVIGLVVSGR